MDPLSITASVIAVLGAVSATGKTICKIKALRRAPEELAALLGEVDALHSVLIIAQAGLRRVHDTPAFEEVKEPLRQLFARAEANGIELHRLLEYQLKRSEELDEKGRLKVRTRTQTCVVDSDHPGRPLGVAQKRCRTRTH